MPFAVENSADSISKSGSDVGPQRLRRMIFVSPSSTLIERSHTVVSATKRAATKANSVGMVSSRTGSFAETQGESAMHTKPVAKMSPRPPRQIRLFLEARSTWEGKHANLRRGRASCLVLAWPSITHKRKTPGLSTGRFRFSGARKRLRPLPAGRRRRTGRSPGPWRRRRARRTRSRPSGRHRRSGSRPSARGDSRRCAWRSAGRAS
jgi:hypothetical protein